MPNCGLGLYISGLLTAQLNLLNITSSNQSKQIYLAPSVACESETLMLLLQRQTTIPEGNQRML